MYNELRFCLSNRSPSFYSRLGYRPQVLYGVEVRRVGRMIETLKFMQLTEPLCNFAVMRGCAVPQLQDADPDFRLLAYTV